MTSLSCNSEHRREDVRRQAELYGLDYLDVDPEQTTLTVHFLGQAPEGVDELGQQNVLIEGGRRIRDIKVRKVITHPSGDPEFDDTLEVVVNRAGDFSTYTLRIVERDEDGKPHPHRLFDPRYDSLEFNFKIDCPSELDCKAEPACPVPAPEQPEVNYLAKDYSSFRQLILDRLALLTTDWRERHVPDLGIALVELLAYAGDYLSYFQDAVATEAYLETARQRISVRRHARLVDYQLHEGSNARSWITLKTQGNPLEFDPRKMYFITRPKDAPSDFGAALTSVELQNLSESSYEVYEPISNDPIRLFESHSEIHFYTWGDDECCLDRAAISATLIGKLVKKDDEPDCPLPEPPRGKKDKKQPSGYDQSEAQDEKTDQPYQAGEGTGAPYDLKDQESGESSSDKSGSAYEHQGNNDNYDNSDPGSQQSGTPELHLQPGDVLIFEEGIGPKTGNPSDADHAHRHVVRLTRVEPAEDPLNGQSLVEVEWATEDRLPFPLCLSALGPAPDCKIIRDVSVARGNVVLVDHGRTTAEATGPVPVAERIDRCDCEGMPADTVFTAGKYRPVLQKGPLTFAQLFDPATPAARALIQDVRQTRPQVRLTSEPAPNDDAHWIAQPDLLGSSALDQHFVAEIDNDGRAHLRFGDGELGRRPAPKMEFKAVYRVGNGPAGNVGSETIKHIVFREQKVSGAIVLVRNPLPASGGTPPEPIAEAKLFAPHAFRQQLQRAIIADDYRALVERDFPGQVQRAAATLRWDGAHYEALVAVDEFGRKEADRTLLTAIERRLQRYRRIGHDVRVQAARLVPLLIEMRVCVDAHYLTGDVKAELLDLFSNRVLADGRRGFFHPDDLSFGEEIYLSVLIAAAQAVEGVTHVEVTRLERLGEGPNQEIENGVLPLQPFEVAQLDNDPSLPENGAFKLTMGGGI